jgi:hypothetical protein
MSADRLLTAIIVGLLATSLASSLAAFHLYQHRLEQFPQVSDLDDEIGVLGMDLFQGDDSTFDVDSIVAQLIGLNSTREESG